jgi:hypothetical protein
MPDLPPKWNTEASAEPPAARETFMLPNAAQDPLPSGAIMDGVVDESLYVRTRFEDDALARGDRHQGRSARGEILHTGSK